MVPINHSIPWFYQGPYVPSGVIYGECDWPSRSHWLVPGWDETQPFGLIDIYDKQHPLAVLSRRRP